MSTDQTPPTVAQLVADCLAFADASTRNLIASLGGANENDTLSALEGADITLAAAAEARIARRVQTEILAPASEGVPMAAGIARMIQHLEREQVAFANRSACGAILQPMRNAAAIAEARARLTWITWLSEVR